VVERITGRKLQALRLRIWSGHPYCARCKSLTAHPDGYELDHAIALTNSGTNDDDNLQVLCHPCHEVKTNEDLGHKPKVEIGADGWPVDKAASKLPRWRRAARGRVGGGRNV
jgi:5-methylcytosine-specific restriction endonuclease McrA